MAFSLVDPFLGKLSGPRILIYHQVGAGLGREMEVTFATFKAQLDWLADHGRVISLEDALATRMHPDTDRDFVLTFDDGYDDMFRLAFPLLAERRLPFTLYLSTHPTESGEPLFTGGRAEPITWDQVKTMRDSGLMTLGAHTHSHPDMRTTTRAMAKVEIERSNELITDRVGVTPRHFTYPWGYWSADADPAVRQAYDSATVGSGAGSGDQPDPYKVNRVPVQLSDGVLFFKQKMRRGLQGEDKLRRKLRGYAGP